MIAQPGLECGINFLRRPGIHFLVDIIDTVNESHLPGLLGGNPMVLPIEIGILYLLTGFPGLGSVHVRKRILQRLQLLGDGFHLLLVAVTPPIRVMEHQTGVLAHIYRFPAQGDDTGHACGNAVDIDGYIRIAGPEGVEYGHACIHAPSRGIHTHVYAPVHGSVFIQLGNNVLVVDPVKTADLPVQEDAGGIRGGYHVKVSLFHRSS